MAQEVWVVHYPQSLWFYPWLHQSMSLSFLEQDIEPQKMLPMIVSCATLRGSMLLLVCECLYKWVGEQQTHCKVLFNAAICPSFFPKQCFLILFASK